MIDDIRTILVSNSDVNDNVNGVFIAEPDQSAKLPFIVISEDQTIPNDSKDSVSRLDQARITVNCRSSLYHTKNGVIGANEIGEYVRIALDHYSDETYFIQFDDQRTIPNRLKNKPSYEKEMEFELHVSR